MFLVDHDNIPVIARDIKKITAVGMNPGILDEFQRLVCSEIQNRYDSSFARKLR